MRELARLNRYLFRYKWRLLLGTAFVFLSNFFKVQNPGVVNDAINDVVAFTKGKEVTFQLVSDVLLVHGAKILGFTLLMGIFMFFMRQTIIVTSRLIEFDFRNDIYDHYQRLSSDFYKRNSTGDMMSRISEDVNKVRMYLGPAIMYGVNLVSLFVLVIVHMLQESVELTIYALLPLPLLSFSIYYVSNIINRKSTSIQSQLSTLTTTAQESFSGIRVIKSYVQGTSMAKFFERESANYKTKSLSLARTEALFQPLMLLLTASSTLIIIFVGGRLYMEGKIQEGNIAQFIIYVNMLTWPVTAVGWVASIIQTASASQKRINEFLDEEPSIAEDKEPIFLNHIDQISFNEVDFVYPDTGIKALSNVSFKLNKGEKVAIVGKTGSGKTSIAELCLRMYDITAGTLMVNGRSIEEHSLSGLRSKVAYVPQDVFLFSDTIDNNVRFSNDQIPDSAIEKYTKFTHVYNDIIGFKDGFKTLVGERGITLSGGQKQRVSMARALIKPADLVIFDDCLSALDAKTEDAIVKDLNVYLKDKSSIFITHRIPKDLHFDRYLVLEDGCLVGEGTYDELIETNVVFRDLFLEEH